ncbi:6-phosphogluconolactonase [Orbus hercynius]|uniref:6-phosphogluconolactonase n=1 Tax=Orbus hercynius TaxID=593135 RepID=A0A495RD48_9GAMM|nr:6-phosphogluconolactonase [Orbus hercynius]RKS85190.1 6-phosphogluconolactonase [Orbus hercynius]
MFKLNEYASAAQLTQAMTDHIVSALNNGIKTRGFASIAVSGGKTPIPLFKQLSQQHLDWSKVYITLVDDRWVDSNDDASNEKLVFMHLLQNEAKQAHFIGLKNSATTPFAGESITQKKLAEIPMPLDVVILGMGEDGHTASLFPHAKNLPLGLDMHSSKQVVGMTPLTAPLDRITLTLPAILNSHNIYLLLVGTSKKTVLEQAIQGNNITDMPIRAILQQKNVDVTGFWCE